MTITARVLDSKYKVIGTVIAVAKNANLIPGLQTSFSGLGSVYQGTKPTYFKLTFVSLSDKAKPLKTKRI